MGSSNGFRRTSSPTCVAALDDVGSRGTMMCGTGEDLAACFRGSVSGSGWSHARIDVVKFLAVQDICGADFCVLEGREWYIVSGDRAAVHDPDVGMNHLVENSEALAAGRANATRGKRPGGAKPAP
jgi:hypothetical protein